MPVIKCFDDLVVGDSLLRNSLLPHKSEQCVECDEVACLPLSETVFVLNIQLNLCPVFIIKLFL